MLKAILFTFAIISSAQSVAMDSGSTGAGPIDTGYTENYGPGYEPISTWFGSESGDTTTSTNTSLNTDNK